MDNNGKTGSDIEATRHGITVYRCRALDCTVFSRGSSSLQVIGYCLILP